MTPKTRHRSRSSVDHIFELVGELEEDQLQNLLHELNSTGGNVEVSKGVEFFDEQRRRLGAHNNGGSGKHQLRPTPSFINQPHEPADWPRQKPRPVSGSQWRQSMRIVSTPYAPTLARHQTEPISPPLTASPPSSPPLSPPRGGGARNHHHNRNRDHHDGSSGSPRRSVTAPVLKTTGLPALAPRVEVRSVPSPESPVSPPRELDDVHGQQQGADEDAEASRPSLSEFGSFSFGFGGGAARSDAGREEQREDEADDEEQDRPVSPRQAQTTTEDSALAPAPAPAPAATPAPPQLDFGRMQTMPLPSLHHADESLDAFHGMLPRPRTAAGGDAAAALFGKPRAFRRISRPMFLSPPGGGALPADDLAKKLSAFLFSDLPPSPPAAAGAARSTAAAASARGEERSELEAMLKEPVGPEGAFGLGGRAEREVPGVSGIFEVLKG